MNYKFHPLADLFPLLDETELSDLAFDIGTHGQREPILIHHDQILDGRNRYLACKKAGVNPRFKVLAGNSNALAIVRSLNLKRRHLSESQRAMVAAEMINADKEGQGPNGPLTQKSAAKEMNTSERMVKRAAKVQRSGAKSLKKAVMSGKVSVSAAAAVSKLSKKKQAKLARKGAKAIRQKAAKMARPARGGLAAEQREDKASHKGKAGGKESNLVAVLDKWWADNKERLCSYPQAAPKVVFNELRRVVVDAA